MRRLYFKSDEFEAALAENLRAFEISRNTDRQPGRPDLLCLGESHGSHLFGMKRSILPGTGAILLRVSQIAGDDILLDPGWGTLATARRLKVQLSRVGVILISHCHLDHIGDLHPLLLTLSLAKKRPVLIGNATAINGGKHQPSVLPRYFRELCESVVVGEPGKTIGFPSYDLIPFSTKHRENQDVSGHSLGYVLRFKDPKRTQIGFVTDGPLGQLSPPLMSLLRDCTLLLFNIGTISSDPSSPSHSKVFDNALCLHGLEIFLKELAEKPGRIKKIAITHLGAELLEVRAPSMKRFLARASSPDLPSFLESVLKSMVRSTVGRRAAVTVLREGHKLEVSQ
ncbi:MAG: hypothetical protein QOH70_3 [Blastocatellia bacterium]|jgi:hypothetical protein|nr:hypothetical protein [Blastocatellia bacterium]